ncbi:related to Maintenance of telomere capping protein 5 [Zygosaccharomyces bailii ISA1307]|nr:related to Maintenance of telomere capping protein 5 [Zygosaccharomyces bailii ISA1307]
MAGYVGGDPYQSPTFGKSLSLKVEAGVNALSINPSGRDVVLASKQGLYIIDLDDPFSPPRWLRHITPWQVADVQWSPHPSKSYWVVSTSNQKAIIWNLAKPSSNAIEHVLHKHYRAITDINFSPQHPDILATCSIDTYVHAWDMRSPQRPFYTTSGWLSGASQVKWNFNDQNVLASSHGNDVCIWDLRKGSTPLGNLVGHGSSVNSVDFNRFKQTELMTGSNDGTVKFWNYSLSCNEPIQTIRTNFPIWRGRYLPFGEGCCLMPSVGGSNSVYVASLANKDIEETKDTKLQPIYAFKGHSGRVTDFVWRSRSHYNDNESDREFQLVTWSEDCDLRLWPVPESVYGKVNFDRKKRPQEHLPSYDYISYNKDPENEHTQTENNYRRIHETFVTTSGVKAKKNVNHISWLSGVRMNHNNSPESIFKEKTLQNLGEEVSSLGHKFPKVVFEKISVSTGELIITLNGPWSETNPEEYVFLRIDVKVPSEYPSKGNRPRFTIEDNGNLSNQQRQEITQNLKQISEKCTNSGLFCLEPCLRLLLGEKVNLDDIGQDNEPLLNFDIAGQFDLENISSPASAQEDTAEYLSDSTTESEENRAGDVFSTGQKMDGQSQMDLTLDSTPVPTECGAVWSPGGYLLCSFASESKQDKKQQTMLRLASRDALKYQISGLKKGSSKNAGIQEDSTADAGKGKRPKRYVDTIPTSASAVRSTYDTSDEESPSDEYSDSFEDDWGDILANDIVVRTKLPALRGRVSKTFESVHSGSGKTTESKKDKNVLIYKDFSHLIPDRKDLALEYRFTDAPQEELARHNALVAEKYGLEEKSHCWQILSDLLMTNEETDPYNLIWDNHPMGISWLIKEALNYFEKRNDLQMLAMLGAVAASTEMSALCYTRTQNEDNEDKKLESTISFNPNESAYSWRTDMFSHLSSSNGFAPSLLEGNRHKHSPDEISIKSEDYFSPKGNSHGIQGPNISPPVSNTAVSATVAHNQQISSRMPHVTIELTNDDVLSAIKEPVRRLLDPDDAAKFRFYSYQYSKLLYRWGLAMQRVELLKIGFESTRQDQFNFDSSIPVDMQGLFGDIRLTWKEDKNKSATFRNCNYCALKVTRNVFVCESCEHIMHASCARDWWTQSKECASGCGCPCPELFKLV